MEPKTPQKILRILLIPIVLLIILPVVIIITAPIFLLRIIVKCVAKLKPELGEILSSTSAFLVSSDDLYGRPRCNITTVYYLDGKISLDQLQQIVLKNALSIKNADGIMNFKELKQYPVKFLGFPFYQWDRKFDIKNHVKSYTKEIATQDELFKYISCLNYLPFKKQRSLWEISLLDNYHDPDNQNTSVFLFRCHHSLADGYSLVNLILKTLGEDKNLDVPAAASAKMNVWEKIGLWISFPFLATYDLINDMLDNRDVNPFRTKENKILSGNSKCAPCDKIPLGFIKEIMAAHKVSFHAVVAAAIGGGLRKYLFGKQMEIPAEMHGISPGPYPGHPAESLHNHFSIELAEFHVGVDNPIERLQMTHQSHKDYQRSTLPVVNFYFQKFVGSFFMPIQKLLVHNAWRVTTVFSNFPIAANQLKFQGIPLPTIQVTFGFMEPKCGMSLMCCSYNRNIQILVLTDDSLFPLLDDTKSIARFIAEEFLILKKLKKE